jgi:hypothetical protein
MVVDGKIVETYRNPASSSTGRPQVSVKPGHIVTHLAEALVFGFEQDGREGQDCRRIEWERFNHGGNGRATVWPAQEEMGSPSWW